MNNKLLIICLLSILFTGCDQIPKKGDIQTVDGKDYILTAKDKTEIAGKIKIPVVTKEIETIIKEQPIITNEIKEVAKYEKAEEIKDKLETLKDDDRLSATAIKDLPEYTEKIIKGGVTGRGIYTYVSGEKKGLLSSIDFLF